MEPKKKKHPKIFLYITIFLILYTLVSIWFMTHFFLGTKINGVSVETLSIEEAKVVLEPRVEQQKIQIIGKTEEVVGLEELGLSFDLENEVILAKRGQNGFLWPRMIWKEDNLYLDLTIKESQEFEKKLKDLECVKNQEPFKDAEILMKEDGYELVNEEEGSEIDILLLSEKIKECFSTGIRVLELEAEGCYKKPTVLANSLEMIEACEQLDTWLETEITYIFDLAEVLIDKATIANWISVDGCQVSLDEEAIPIQLETLAVQNNGGKTTVSFNSTSKGKILLKNTTYERYLDIETEAEYLLEAIIEGKKEARKPVYITEDGEVAQERIGDTYVEVDLSAQHLWYYEEGKLLMETDVVTGNISRGHGTPTMISTIYAKQENRILRGDGYASHVDYWMPFYKGYGLHDAKWRSKFGGEIYKTNGSHGCINLPKDKAKLLYEFTEVGTIVVIYK